MDDYSIVRAPRKLTESEYFALRSFVQSELGLGVQDGGDDDANNLDGSSGDDNAMSSQEQSDNDNNVADNTDNANASISHHLVERAIVMIDNGKNVGDVLDALINPNMINVCSSAYYKACNAQEMLGRTLSIFLRSLDDSCGLANAKREGIPQKNQSIPKKKKKKNPTSQATMAAGARTCDDNSSGSGEDTASNTESVVDEEEFDHVDVCFVCDNRGEADLIQSDSKGCNKSYHAECVSVDINTPPLTRHCPSCQNVDRINSKVQNACLSILESSLKSRTSEGIKSIHTTVCGEIVATSEVTSESSNELECLVDKQARTISTLIRAPKRAIGSEEPTTAAEEEATQKLKTECESLQVQKLKLEGRVETLEAESIADKNSIGALREASQSLFGAMEDMEKQYGEQLVMAETSYRTLQSECETLQVQKKEKDAEYKLERCRSDVGTFNQEEFRNDMESIRTLQEENRTLEDSRKKAEESELRHKQLLREFSSLHTSLRATCVNLEDGLKRQRRSFRDGIKSRNETIKSLEEDIELSKETVNALQEKNRLLVTSNALKEKEIRTLQRESEESTRSHKERLDASKYQNELVRKSNRALARLHELDKRRIGTLEDNAAASRMSGGEEVLDEATGCSAVNSVLVGDDASGEVEDAAKLNGVQVMLLNNCVEVAASGCVGTLKDGRASFEGLDDRKEEKRPTPEKKSPTAEQGKLFANHTILEGETLYEEKLCLERLVEILNRRISELQEAKRCLEDSNETKEKQIQTFKSDFEGTRGLKEKLNETKATCEKLVARQSALECKYKDLESRANGVAMVKGEEVLLLKNEAKVTKAHITDLEKAKRCLERDNETKENLVQTLKSEVEGAREQRKHLDAFKAAHKSLLEKHTALIGKYKDLGSMDKDLAKMKEEEVQSLKNAVETFNRHISELQEEKGCLERSNETKEKQIQTFKSDLESARGHKEQIDALKTAHNAALEDGYNNLKSLHKGLAKLKDEEVQSLKNDVETANKRIRELQYTKRCLEGCNETKEREIHTLKLDLEVARGHKEQIYTFEAARKKLLEEHTAFEGERNNLVSLAKVKEEEVQSLKNVVEAANECISEVTRCLQRSNETKGKQIYTLKLDLVGGRRQKKQLDESKGTCEKLIAKQSALEDGCKNLENLSRLNDEHVQSLKNDVQTANERIRELQEAKQCLERCNETQEKQVQTLKLESESARGHKEQLDLFEAAHNNLLEKHAILIGKCNNLESLAKVKDEEVQSLKNAVEAANERISKMKRCLEESNETKEKKVQMLNLELEGARGHKGQLDASEVMREKLLLKQLSLKDECKNLQSEVKKLLLNMTVLEKDREDTKRKLKEVSVNIESQKEASECLNGQLIKELKCSNSQTERKVSLQGEMQQIRGDSSSSGTETVDSRVKTKDNNLSSEIATSEHDIVADRDDRKVIVVVTAGTKLKVSAPPIVTSSSFATSQTTTSAESKVSQNANSSNDHNNDTDTNFKETAILKEEINEHKESPACASSSATPAVVTVAVMKNTQPKVGQHMSVPSTCTNFLKALLDTLSEECSHNHSYSIAVELQSDHFGNKKSSGEDHNKDSGRSRRKRILQEMKETTTNVKAGKTAGRKKCCLR